jgi:DNA-binding NarL/FixJ family response regulator
MRQALVVDDHPVVRDSVKTLLERSCPSLEVKTSPGRDEVLDEICGTPWAFVVLDINLPTSNGLDILKQARGRSNTPIIIFSLYAEEQYGGRAVSAGAAAYLSKDRSALEIVKVANDILAGRMVNKPVLTGPALSDRERQVLALLVRGIRRGEIAVRLAINEKTVSTYQTRLFQKLNVRNLAGLVRYALEERLVAE